MIKNLPFEFKAWDPQDITAWSFYDVTFTRDFGLIEKDQTFKFAELDLRLGTITTYAEDGISILNTVTIDIVAALDNQLDAAYTVFGDPDPK